MEQLIKEFNEQIRIFQEGEITQEDLFVWVTNKIVQYGGKLPPKADDIAIPPDAR